MVVNNLLETLNKMENNNIMADRQFTVVMYDVKETAQILGVTTRTIMNYIRDGKIKAQKVGGKWKISKENLESFCNGN